MVEVRNADPARMSAGNARRETDEHGARAIHEPRPLLGIRETAAKVAQPCESEGG
jgi:hypothetical protein